MKLNSNFRLLPESPHWMIANMRIRGIRQYIKMSSWYKHHLKFFQNLKIKFEKLILTFLFFGFFPNLIFLQHQFLLPNHLK